MCSSKYIGRLKLDGIKPDEIPELAEQMGIEITHISTMELSSFYKLPRLTNHKDPFDRAIIWHSISNQYILMSQDSKFKEYKSYGLNLF